MVLSIPCRNLERQPILLLACPITIFIYFSNISTNFLGRQTKNSDQGAIIRWSFVPHVANLKINAPQGKFILEFAVILVKQCRCKQ